MSKQITSIHNPYVKYWNQLREKSSFRKKQQRFVLEGRRELHWAKVSGYSIERVMYCPEIFPFENITKCVSTETEVIEISKQVYQKLAYRDSTEGILAEGVMKSHHISDMTFSNENPLVLVMEAPEKPGNIGAILRTADAARLDAVLIANPKTDLYNPNIIRSSVGGVFTNYIGVGSTEEILTFLKSKDFSIYATALSASVPYYEVSFKRASAIVVGTEDVGLSDRWTAGSTQNIIIPMRGKIDSMNVSVAAGIVIFEAIRQREIEL